MNQTYNTVIGLTTSQANERKLCGQYNKSVEAPTKTVKQIILSNIFTYFNLIFFIIAIALICVGGFKHLTFLGVIFFNTVIGIYQEINSKKTLDKLSLINAPTAVVFRDGQAVKIPTEELVIDDIVVLGAGNQISADAVVVSGSVNVNEALVTGEADEIVKNNGDTLLSGSFVVSGKCYAQLTAVGEKSFVSQLTLDAKKMKKKQRAGMMKSLTLLVKIIGIIIIPIGAFLMYNELNVHGSSISDAVINTSAAIIGMIPEGLYLLTTVALAVSVMRLAKQRTLVHELGCIEALARVDMLCVDKTGTITEPEMSVTGIISLDDTYTDEELTVTVRDLVCNLEPDNDTMKALRSYFMGEITDRALKTVPFSSSIKYSGAAFEKHGNLVIGAPEFVLMTRYGEIREEVEKHSSLGERVLLLASYDYELDGGALISNGVHVIALVTLVNKVRENAFETFKYFQDSGVEVKVISGDDPRTASGAASQAGIIGAENYINARELTDEAAIEDAALKYTVFGRVTPDQKRSLIRALKKSGHTVAMTGDGVNDVLALKEADCSVAMASGSDVAAQVSDLVLLDSDFAAMPSVVAEGRRVINNIERTASLFLVKNIFSFFLAIIAIIAMFEYPISPANLSLINGLTIGAPAFILSLEPNTEKVKGKFLRNVLYRAAPAGLCNLFCIIFVVMFREAFKLPADEVGTMCTILLANIGFIMLFITCTPWNKLRIALFATMIAGFFGGYLLLGGLFDVVPLSFGCGLITTLLFLMGIPLMITFRWLFDKMSQGFKKIKAEGDKHFGNTFG